jgi:tRNA threonylcarbamoyladenosine biosynthesis protein TsaB
MGIGHPHGIENDMTGILAIETATDACSVAVFVDAQIRECYAIAPRQHSKLLFAMLEALLPGGNLGIAAIAYGSGPGSFTGLRIAASVVQGLSYSCDLPAIAVSTLSVLAQSAWRVGDVGVGDTVLCTLDARINEVYSAVYSYEDDLAVLREGPWACAPADLSPREYESMQAVGSGCHFLHQFPQSLRERIRSSNPDLLPAARDLIPLALAKFQCGEIQSPRQVQPVYVRDEISWKKLAEQGRRP